MKVLLLGSGGREHTLAWKLSQSRKLGELLVAPGNPGTAQLGRNVSLDLDDLQGLADFSEREGVDLTVVGPEAPLVAGIVDLFRSRGLLIAGPTRQGAALEGSKVFAKEFMQRHRIPTAACRCFSNPEDAEEAIRNGEFIFPLVVKADGLAAGKGVFICPNLESALEAVGSVMRERHFGSSGDQVVIEEFLMGEEASFMVFTDGRQVLPMVPSQDHKAAYDGDKGPNTGGMGAYSAPGILSREQTSQVLDDIIEPTLDGMRREGRPYSGVLYAGLMLTATGPKVLEFNVRFGDPEAQVVLPRLESDLLELMAAVAREDLEDLSVSWSSDAVVCVVLASQGYPGSYSSGTPITGLELAEEIPDTVVFHAGTALKGERLVTAGGRVLGLTARASNLQAAVVRAYEGVNKIHFEGMHYRRDIAAKGLEKQPG